MLGKDKMDNYHSEFMIRLSNFSNNLNYDELIRSDPDFLTALAQKWPGMYYSINISYSLFEK